jgi:hypothetical protein
MREAGGGKREVGRDCKAAFPIPMPGQFLQTSALPAYPPPAARYPLANPSQPTGLAVMMSRSGAVPR